MVIQYKVLVFTIASRRLKPSNILGTIHSKTIGDSIIIEVEELRRRQTSLQQFN